MRLLDTCAEEEAGKNSIHRLKNTLSAHTDRGSGSYSLLSRWKNFRMHRLFKGVSFHGRVKAACDLPNKPYVKLLPSY